jgi:hypothetical protein
VLLDIDEHRLEARPQNGVDSRGERERRHQYLPAASAADPD